MKRDLDLIRRVVLVVEKSCDGRKLLNGADIAGEAKSDERTVNYHLKLLHDEALIETKGEPHYTSRHHDSVPDRVLVSGLTCHGHEFVEAARDDSRWKKFLKEQGPQMAGAALGAVIQSVLGLTFRG